MNAVKKLWGKFEAMSAPVKASVAFAVCSVLQRGLSTITVPLFTRLLTTEQYGVYTVYSSWYSIIQLLATLNLYCGVFNNGMTKFEHDRDRFHSSMLGLSTTVTAVILVVYLAASDLWDQILGLNRILIIFMFAELFFLPAFQFWSTRQRFNYRYKALVTVTLATSVASPIIGVIAVLSTQYKAEARVFSYVIVQVAVGVFFYIQTFRRDHSFFHKAYWKFGLAFNLPLIPHYLSGIVLNQADRLMINSMIGSSEAAIYGVAYNLAYMVSIFTSSINNSYVPYTYQKLKSGDYRDLRKSSTGIALVVLLPIVIIMALGPELIRIFATQEYYAAIWIIPPVAASVFVNFIYSFFVNVEFYYEKNKFIMVASSIGAVLNIVLNYIFIGRYGYLAAGYTTLFCYLAFMLAHYIFFRKIMKQEHIQEKIYNVRFFAGLVVLIVLIMGLMLVLYQFMVIRYLAIVLLLAVCVFKRKSILQAVRDIRKKG